VNRLIPSFALAFIAASCQFAGPAHDAEPRALPPEVAPHPSPYTPVMEGDVHALIPHQWAEVPIQSSASIREGLMASPDLERWDRLDGSVPGLEIAWVDAGRLGIPSDYYYLAANGPAIPRIASSPTCTASQDVILDHRPEYGGLRDSPGDYVASGGGTCRLNGAVNRWASFVAAPGYGPLREMGIRSSGLYTAFAVLPDGPDADRKLHTLLLGAGFGSASVGELMAAAREAARRD
jgi:hypothetical protein